ncbi:MAG: esterase-like activity of phytase family protein [Fimbriimonadaceae bacterium]|nr:esterase-like activity of phytase family protein [Alphaproteobacteria bacterium]
MRILTGMKHRLVALLLVIASAAALMLPVPASAKSQIQVVVAAEAFSFDINDPEKVRFGELEWRGGLVLTSNDPRFGGISGLVVSPDGQSLIGITDVGRWVTADLRYAGWRLTGIENVSLRPIEGRILLAANSDKRIDNMEGLAVHTSPQGETILTLVSDNNFRDSQRTLIMQFALP